MAMSTGKRAAITVALVAAFGGALFFALRGQQETQAVQQQGPIYLRSFALSVYDNFEWQASSQDGFWIKDEEDGKTPA